MSADIQMKHFEQTTILAVNAMIALVWVAQGAPEGAAILAAPTVFELTLGGKIVGKTTIQQGTKVRVVRENPETGELLVKGPAGETWLPKTGVIIQETAPEPAPTQIATNPTTPNMPESAGENRSPAPQRPRTSGVLEVVREIPYPTRYSPPQIPARSGGGQTVVPATPTAFATRKVGTVMRAGTEPGPGATTEVSVDFETTELEGFVDYGSGIKQPVFGQTRLKTSETRETQTPPKTHPLGVAVWNWLQEDAGGRQTLAVQAAPGSPAQAASSLSGLTWEKDGEKGALRVEIDLEIQQDLPGIPEEALAKIEAALSDGGAVLADLSRKNWNGRGGELSPEETPKNPPQPARVCILRAEGNGEFVLTAGPKGEVFRIGRAELLRATCAAATATVSWVPQTSGAEPFPAGFDYKSTLIKPGHYAFLALPFQRQEQGGICAAASTLNVVKFLDPEIGLAQKELFALFNGRSGGASPQEVLAGLETLGFDGELVSTKHADRKATLAKTRAALDEGRPIIAAVPGHALTIVGYSKASGRMIAWDQAKKSPGKPAYLPQGGYEVPESSLSSRFEYLLFVRKSWDAASASEEAAIKAVLPSADNLRKHQVGRGSRETLSAYLRHATAPRLKAAAAGGCKVLLPDKTKGLVELVSENGGKWAVTRWPGGTPGEETQASLASLLCASGGTFYSTPPKTL